MLIVIVITSFSSARIAIYHSKRKKLPGWSWMVRIGCPLGFVSGVREEVTGHHGLVKPDIPSDGLL